MSATGWPVISKDIPVQKLISDAPFLSSGTVAFAMALLLVSKRRLTITSCMILLASFFNFVAVLVDLGILIVASNSQMSPNAGPENVGTLPSRVTREMFLSSATVLVFLFFWHLAFDPQRSRSSSALSKSPPDPTSLDAGEGTSHKISFLVVIKYLLLLAVLSVGVLEALWRVEVAFETSPDGSMTASTASATMQVALSVVFAVILLVSQRPVRIRAASMTPYERNPPRVMESMISLSPALIGIAVAAGIGIGNLAVYRFSDYPLGRLLGASMIYLLNVYVVFEAYSDVEGPRGQSRSDLYAADVEKNSMGDTIQAHRIALRPMNQSIYQTPSLPTTLRELALPASRHRQSYTHGIRHPYSRKDRVASWVTNRLSYSASNSQQPDRRRTQVAPGVAKAGTSSNVPPSRHSRWSGSEDDSDNVVDIAATKSFVDMDDGDVLPYRSSSKHTPSASVSASASETLYSVPLSTVRSRSREEERPPVPVLDYRRYEGLSNLPSMTSRGRPSRTRPSTINAAKKRRGEVFAETSSGAFVPNLSVQTDKSQARTLKPIPSPIYGLDGPFIPSPSSTSRSASPAEPPLRAKSPPQTLPLNPPITKPSVSENRSTPLRYQAIFQSHSQSRKQSRTPSSEADQRNGNTDAQRGSPTGATGPESPSSPDDVPVSRQISEHLSENSFLRFSLGKFPLPPALPSGRSQEETEGESSRAAGGGEPTPSSPSVSVEGSDVFDLDLMNRIRDSGADLDTSDLVRGFELVSPPMDAVRPSRGGSLLPPRSPSSPRSPNSPRSPRSPPTERPVSTLLPPARSSSMVRHLNLPAGVPDSPSSHYRSGLVGGGAVPYGRYATTGTEITSFIGAGGVGLSASPGTPSRLRSVRAFGSPVPTPTGLNSDRKSRNAS